MHDGHAGKTVKATLPGLAMTEGAQAMLKTSVGMGVAIRDGKAGYTIAGGL